VSNEKFVRDVILPLHGKNHLSERRKVVERDSTCCGKVHLQASQWRHGLSLVGGELRKTNPCISLWFASLSWFLAYLICFRFDLLGCVICVCIVCAGINTLLVIIYQGHSSGLVRVRGQEELESVLQVLCQAPVWPMQGSGLTGASCEAEPVTGLIGHHHRSNRWHLLVQVFAEEKFKLVVPLIHPRLSDIKVLSPSWVACGKVLPLLLLYCQSQVIDKPV
jgi:hypothetical protein